MNRLRIDHARLPDIDWIAFPGGELEGRRPRVLCPECRSRLQQAASGGRPVVPPLCFQCYRLDFERERRIREAADLNTASEARFQHVLPFEPVNKARLTRLKAERQRARQQSRKGTGRYAERRVRAQIEARHQLGRLLLGLKERRAAALTANPAAVVQAGQSGGGRRRQPLQAAMPLPESWLPFVVAR